MSRYEELKEVSQLVANDSEQGDWFGAAVAISADGLVAMVGADSNSTKATNAGKVYTYKRSSIDADWEEVNQLVASDGEEYDHFGTSISISADGLVAMVGANAVDTKADKAGKVYTYKRNNIGSDWEEVNQLVASDGKEDDFFGTSVALSADGLVAMIGAAYEDTKATNAGKVYTYKRGSMDEDWQEVNQLVASDGKKYDYFGTSVALSSDGLVAMIGAFGDDTKAINAGKVYTYKRNNIDSDWQEVNQLVASDGKKYDYFGTSVALSENGLIAMVGAQYKDIITTNNGKVYVYKRSNIDADWEEINQLIPSDSRSYGCFSSSIALSANGLAVLVGAYGVDNKVGLAGKAYTYKA